MKIKKIVFAALAITLLCASGAMVFANGQQSAPASGGAAASGAPVEITMWQLSSRQAGFESLVAEFNQANPGIKVTMAFYDTDGIKDACKVAATSGTLPDFWFNWGGSLGGFYAENDLVYDLTQYAKDHNWDKIYSPGALQLCTLYGKLAGYPTSYNVISMYYSKPTMEKLGITTMPATFDDFEKMCADIKAKGVTPISTAGQYGWHVMRFLELLVEHYCGPEMHDQMNQFLTSWDNPQVVQALTKFKEYSDKGYFPQGFLTANPNDTHIALINGSCAMDVQGQWYDGTLIQNGQKAEDYGIFAFPSGGKNRMSAFAEMAQINKNVTPDKLDAIIKFLDFLYSEASVAKQAQYYNLPLPRLDAKMPAGQPNVPLAIANSNANGTFTITDQAFPTEVADELFRVQDGLCLGQVTPEDGAKRIQAAIDAYKANQ